MLSLCPHNNTLTKLVSPVRAYLVEWVGLSFPKSKDIEADTYGWATPEDTTGGGMVESCCLKGDMQQ